MLHQGKFKQSATEPPRVIWGNKEWELIAAELKRRHPGASWRVFQHLYFTMEEFDEAMEAVIDQERQKAFATFGEIRSHLFDANERLKHTKPVTLDKIEQGAPVRTHIKWKDDDWEKVVIALHRAYPDLFENRLESLRFRDIETAMNVLDEDRRRRFSQLEAFRKVALKVWDELPQKPRVSQVEKRAVVDFKSGPIVAPLAKKSDDSSAIAVALHTAFKESAEAKATYKKKVFWTHDEAIKVAREMCRQDPNENFFRKSFAVIDLPALRNAQRAVLSLERRKGLHGTKGLQEQLLDMFKLLAHELAIEENVKRSVKKYEVPAPLIEQEVIVHSSPDPVKFIAPGQKIDAPNDLMARLTQAAMPLLDVIIGEFAKHLAPEIIKAFTPMMEQAVQDIKKATTPVFVREPLIDAATALAPNMDPYSALRAPFKEVMQASVKPKKPRIAAMLTPVINREDLQRTFPEYEFLFVEHGHGFKEAGNTCELFIASAGCLTSTNREAINKYVPKDRYKVVDGAISMVKRTIEIWKSQKQGI